MIEESEEQQKKEEVAKRNTGSKIFPKPESMRNVDLESVDEKYKEMENNQEIIKI